MSLILGARELSDVECLLDGSYSPLTGFMTQIDYDSVVKECRLANGRLWSMPIVLHISPKQIEALGLDGSNPVLPEVGLTVTLRDETFLPVALMTVSDLYRPDFAKECRDVYGTLEMNHPSVKRIMAQNGFYLGGSLTVINPIQHYDFLAHRRTPEQTKAEFEKRGWTKILGFQTRNPMHRSHYELTRLGMEIVGEDCKLLLHPIVGESQEVDVDYVTRCQCYEEILKYYPADSVLLSLLPYSMRMGGPREALTHAIIRKNYGCTHFVVGRDHAGPSYKTQDGKAFYGPYDAQNFVKAHEGELGLKVITVPNIVYIEGEGYFREDEITDEQQSSVKNISGTQMRSLLRSRQPIPDWYTYPEISQILQKQYDLTSKGLCVYLIGLPSSGKTTIAQALKARLMEKEFRPITVLDGDVIRNHLSQGLGFSKADRSMNVRRIGFVASEIVKHGGFVICANIAPYEEDRQYNRKLISAVGRYVEVYVNTPLDICEQRDIKGLYKAAREGKVKGMTGIDDPYEPPQSADLILVDGSINEQLEKILSHCE